MDVTIDANGFRVCASDNISKKTGQKSVNIVFVVCKQMRKWKAYAQRLLARLFEHGEALEDATAALIRP
jgi:hypothetical protein